RCPRGDPEHVSCDQVSGIEVEVSDAELIEEEELFAFKQGYAVSRHKAVQHEQYSECQEPWNFPYKLCNDKVDREAMNEPEGEQRPLEQPIEEHRYQLVRVSPILQPGLADIEEEE